MSVNWTKLWSEATHGASRDGADPIELLVKSGFERDRAESLIRVLREGAEAMVPEVLKAFESAPAIPRSLKVVLMEEMMVIGMSGAVIFGVVAQREGLVQ